MAGRRNFILKFLLAAGALLPVSKLFSKATKSTMTNSEDLRKEFILSDSRRFFNNASQGPSPKMVVETIKNSIDSIEQSGESGNEFVPEAREKIAAFLNVDANTISLNRNTTEGINNLAHSLSLKEGDEVLMSKHEHVGGSAPWYALRDRTGVVIKTFEIDYSGKKNLQIIMDHITPKTKVISISHVLCTTGLVMPVKEISAYCRRNGIYSCIDGAQALGMFKIDLADIDADFYAASGHKWLFGPKGTGILYIRKELLNKLTPPFTGAHSLRTFNLDDTVLDYKSTAERFEYGTRNTSHILGLAAAVDFNLRAGSKYIEQHSKNLAKHLRDELGKIEGISVISPQDPAYSSSIITFKPEHKDYREFNSRLRKEYKCRCRAVHENQLNAIRVSLALYNSETEIQDLIQGVKELAK